MLQNRISSFLKKETAEGGNRSGKNAARQSWGMEAEEDGMVISFWKIRLAGEVPGEKKLGRRLGNHAEGFFLKGNNLRERGLGEMLRDRAVGWEDGEKGREKGI